MIAIVAAPSNLGLRPPALGSVPGCAKAPEALREAGLHDRLHRLGAIDAGVVLPGRYAAAHVRGQLRNQAAIIAHTRRLAARIGAVLADGCAPLVLGGDCGILLAAGVALGRVGRYGLIHIDGHTDFRHPGNSDRCADLAGEDLAAAVGRHWADVADIDGLGPYFRPTDTVQVGARDADEHLAEVRETIGCVIPASALRRLGPAASARAAMDVVGSLDGYWLHLDVDVLDPMYLPAVDSPDPGGLTPAELIGLLELLAPRAAGAQVTVFDPDLDPDGNQARLVTDIVVGGLGALAATALTTRGGRPPTQPDRGAQ